MAIVVDGKLVATKDLKKVLAPKKVDTKKSLVGRNVWWIERNSFHLWVGTIKSVDNEIATIDSLNRNLTSNPNKKRETRIVNINLLSFEK